MGLLGLDIFSDRGIMINKVLLFYTALLLCACSSSGSVESGSMPPAGNKGNYANFPGFWLTLPKQDALVIIGLSGRQVKRTAEIESAREDAARKASMYNGIYASFQSVQSIGSGLFDYYTDSETRVEYDQDLEKYMDRLSFDPKRDVITTDDGSFVRFTYPAVFPGNIGYKFARSSNGSPE